MTPFEWRITRNLISLIERRECTRYLYDSFFARSSLFLCSSIARQYTNHKRYFQMARHMRQNIMHTFSGKNGNSIFVFYSIHFFLSVHSFDQIVVVAVVVINYKDFPYIRGAKVGWWHKNHYMRRLCHRIVNFNKCVPRVSEWVCVYGFAFMGAAIWIDIGAVRSL